LNGPNCSGRLTTVGTYSQPEAVDGLRLEPGILEGRGDRLAGDLALGDAEMLAGSDLADADDGGAGGRYGGRVPQETSSS